MIDDDKAVKNCVNDVDDVDAGTGDGAEHFAAATAAYDAVVRDCDCTHVDVRWNDVTGAETSRRWNEGGD